MAVTWITTDDVRTALGLQPGSGVDEDYLTLVVAAANVWARGRRIAAGYTADTDATAPNDAAKVGTMHYAVALYRARGAVEGFVSYTELDAGGPVLPPAAMGMVRQLLGIPRPVTA